MYRVTLSGFSFRWSPRHSGFDDLQQTQYGLRQSTLSFAVTPRASWSSPRSPRHCVLCLTHTVPHSPSHHVVSFARTRLLHCVLFLVLTEPGLPVAQCTRSTLFIWYHKSPSQRDVFRLVPRSHSVFFIFVTVTAFFARTVVCQSLLRTVSRSCSSSAMYCTNTCTQCVSEYCPRPTLQRYTYAQMYTLSDSYNSPGL